MLLERTNLLKVGATPSFTLCNESMIGFCFMILGENKLWILIIHIMIDIDKCQDQTFTTRSNIYVCDNDIGDLFLLGVNALVFFKRSYLFK